MKQKMLILLLMLLPLAGMAQEQGKQPTAGSSAATTALFGYFSYDESLASMPEQESVRKRIGDLRSQYERELNNAEQEFNKKYEEFLEGQRSFAPGIFKKRQAELTDMMQRNIAFKEEAKERMANAETDAIAPLKEKLSSVVAKIARDRGYAFVFNTDNNALPYINSNLGEDITQAIMTELRK